MTGKPGRPGGNHNGGRRKKPGSRHNIRVSDEVWRYLEQTGNASAEIERLVNKERPA